MYFLFCFCFFEKNCWKFYYSKSNIETKNQVKSDQVKILSTDDEPGRNNIKCLSFEEGKYVCLS